MDALSLLLVVASTMGLMALRVRTLTQAVLPLERALSKAGFRSSGFSTNSPCPPIPSNMVWNGISLKSVATCRSSAKRLSCCLEKVVNTQLLSITTVIGTFS